MEIVFKIQKLLNVKCIKKTKRKVFHICYYKQRESSGWIVKCKFLKTLKSLRKARKNVSKFLLQITWKLYTNFKNKILILNLKNQEKSFHSFNYKQLGNFSHRELFNCDVTIVRDNDLLKVFCQTTMKLVVWQKVNRQKLAPAVCTKSLQVFSILKKKFSTV